MEERLQKYLADCGVASRRASEKIIAEGRVRVNGKIITQQGTKVDPLKDSVQVDGKEVRAEEKAVYLLLNKPAGYVTTVKDPQGRPTVIDLLQDIQERVFPVGRLDYETEGLLLLTNDGELAYRMTHPKFQMVKTYIATVKGQLSEEKLARLRDGIKLEDGMTKPAKVKVIRREKYKTVFEIQISEGRNRQIRRMCKTVGNPILELKRISVDNLTLDKVEVGEYRHLTPDEVDRLCARVQLSSHTHQRRQ